MRRLIPQPVKQPKRGCQAKSFLSNLLKISSGLFLWASKNNDTEVKEISAISKSQFLRQRDAEKLNTAKRIYDAANGKDLAFAMITAVDITKLDELITGFKTDIDNFSSGKSKGIAAGKSLDEMLNETISIIKDEMDKYMIQFESTLPEFYNGYKSSRVIWDKGGRQKVEVPVEQAA